MLESFEIIIQLLFIPKNILSILLTLLVLKLDKFKEVKEEHKENIKLISLTLLVLKLDKFKEVKEEHLETYNTYFEHY